MQHPRPPAGAQQGTLARQPGAPAPPAAAAGAASRAPGAAAAAAAPAAPANSGAGRGRRPPAPPGAVSQGPGRSQMSRGGARSHGNAAAAAAAAAANNPQLAATLAAAGAAAVQTPRGWEAPFTMTLNLHGVGIGETKDLALVAVQRLPTRLAAVTDQATMTAVLHMKHGSLRWEQPPAPPAAAGNARPANSNHGGQGREQESSSTGARGAPVSMAEFGVQCDLQPPAAPAPPVPAPPVMQDCGVQCDLQDHIAAAAAANAAAAAAALAVRPVVVEAGIQANLPIEQQQGVAPMEHDQAQDSSNGGEDAAAAAAGEANAAERLQLALPAPPVAGAAADDGDQHHAAEAAGESASPAARMMAPPPPAAAAAAGDHEEEALSAAPAAHHTAAGTAAAAAAAAAAVHAPAGGLPPVPRYLAAEGAWVPVDPHGATSAPPPPSAAAGGGAYGVPGSMGPPPPHPALGGGAAASQQLALIPALPAHSGMGATAIGEEGLQGCGGVKSVGFFGLQDAVLGNAVHPTRQPGVRRGKGKVLPHANLVSTGTVIWMGWLAGGWLR
jgi:hypothetical protein